MKCVNELQCICLHNLDAGKCVLFKELGCSTWLLHSPIHVILCQSAHAPFVWTHGTHWNRYQAVAIGHVNRTPPARLKKKGNSSSIIFYFLQFRLCDILCTTVINSLIYSSPLKLAFQTSAVEAFTGAWSSTHAEICPIYRHGERWFGDTARLQDEPGVLGEDLGVSYLLTNGAKSQLDFFGDLWSRFPVSTRLDASFD